MRIATGEIEETTSKAPGHRNGGVARDTGGAEKPRAEERREIAKKAAAARWR
jgi:hypothetical protein